MKTMHQEMKETPHLLKTETKKAYSGGAQTETI
jgi:hypothetical protein